MTVNELIQRLIVLKNQGHGELEVNKEYYWVDCGYRVHERLTVVDPPAVSTTKRDDPDKETGKPQYVYL